MDVICVLDVRCSGSGAISDNAGGLNGWTQH